MTGDSLFFRRSSVRWGAAKGEGLSADVQSKHFVCTQSHQSVRLSVIVDELDFVGRTIAINLDDGADFALCKAQIVSAAKQRDDIEQTDNKKGFYHPFKLTRSNW